GGIAAVARATGISEATIRKGLGELESGERLEGGPVRRPGGGRKRLADKDPTLLSDLERLVDGDSRGDPEGPLRWTAKSVRTLADALREQGHTVSFRTVARLLRELGYRLQANAKTREGRQHPDRDAQFAHINQTVSAALEAGQPVISVDTKKKELIGDFKNAGREWRPASQPVEVRTHDFQDPVLGKAIPYGIYDVAHDEGWVSVGIDHDTAQFAVAAIHGWWEHLGQQRFPNARTLTITADCGGSNGYRTRLWKTELQRLADHTGLQIRVCHFPPATSKWNKIEHRLFSHISINWRGKPLESRQVIIDLITATTTRTGLKVYARLDERAYPDKIKVTDSELAAVQLQGDPFHPEWNYTIKPRP
ncbi:MAG: ISAzo13 family transposase, partial [Solirubrobacterales bacterium]|nr:ISAzo13 family transposase [Solirubrobacterales bacterium]